MRKLYFIVAVLAIVYGCDMREQSRDNPEGAGAGVENHGGIVSGVVDSGNDDQESVSLPSGDSEVDMVIVEQLEPSPEDFQVMDEQQQARYQQVFGQFNMEEQPFVDEYLSDIARLFARHTGNTPLKPLLIDLDSISERNEFQVMDTFFVKLVEDDWERLGSQGALSESSAIFLEKVFNSEEYKSLSRKIRGLKYEVLFPVGFDEADADNLSELWFMGSPTEVVGQLTLYSSRGNRKQLDPDSEQPDFPVVLFSTITISQM